jgi:hypothetical protein
VIDPLALLLTVVLTSMATGAAIALGVAHWRGLFKPTIAVAVHVVPFSDTQQLDSMPVADRVIMIRPYTVIDWNVLYSAAAGKGLSIVPHEFARPPS